MTRYRVQLAGLLVALGLAAGGAPTAQARQLLFPLRVDSAGLRAFATTVSTPGSPRYGEFATVRQLSRWFGAPPAVRREMVAYLASHGAANVRVDAAGLVVSATFAGATAQLASLPAALAGSIDGVIEPGPAPRPAALIAGPHAGASAANALIAGPHAGASAANPDNSERPRTGTPVGCAAGKHAAQTGRDRSTAGFTPNQYLTAYRLSSLWAKGYRGEGERVGLIEFDGVKRSDVAAFTECFLSAPPPPVHQLPVGLRHLPAPGGEATLDTEILSAVAPRAAGIDLYETRATEAGFVAALTQAIEHGHDQVISISLGECDAQYRAARGSAALLDDRLLYMAAARGITVIAATGDSGSSGCVNPSTGRPEPALATDFPASAQAVVAVGGTNLVLTRANRIAGQLVWNDAPDILAAGGGGVSDAWSAPEFQRNLRRRGRATPDVAMLADQVPGYAFYCTAGPCRAQGGPWLRGGGTSAAAPLFAGGVLLAAQATPWHTLGALDPLLYGAGSGTFFDVTRGSNDIGRYIPGSQGRPLRCCRARRGFDLASGLGGVDFAALAREAVRRTGGATSIQLTIPAGQHPVADGKLVVGVLVTPERFVNVEVTVRTSPYSQFTVATGDEWLGTSWRLIQVGADPAKPYPVVLGFTDSQASVLRSALRHHQPVTAIVSAVVRNGRSRTLPAFNLTS